MLNSKANRFLTSDIYRIALKRCGFGAQWRNLLEQESICLSERVGRGTREGPPHRGNPAPGWFFTLYLRRWGIPLCSSVDARSWRRSLEEHPLPTGRLGPSTRAQSSVLAQHTFTFHRSGKLSAWPPNNAWCLKPIGLAARHFTSSCAAHTNSPASLLESEPGRIFFFIIFLEIAFGAGTFLHRQNVQTLSLGSTFVR